ncbi:MAG: serine/threonine-protein kinase [bacterium]
MSSVSPDFLDLQSALAGEYSLERELGRGGMGVVYLARDVQLDRLVAIKVLPAHLTLADGARERFIREARTAAGLSHPNIVPIHRVGEAGGFVYFVMSYVAGQTLGERLRTKGPLPAADAMRMMREVSWALAYAHGRGVVHRDVKPDNILLEEGSGRALVTDFGIAHVEANGPATDPGKIMGTAHFMSPEQATDLIIDGRSDLYSLGVVGYLTVSGRLPFEAPNVPALLLKQASEIAPSVVHVSPGVPQVLSAAIDRCLQKDPQARFATGEALADALAPAADGRPQLPTMLRAWLRARNPLQGIFTVWAGLMAFAMTADIAARIILHGGGSGLPYTLGLTLAPLVPMIGFHVNQARRLFGAGFTLGDLRTAIDIDMKERSEDELVSPRAMTRSQSVLRGATYLSSVATIYMLAAWGAVTTRGPITVVRSGSFALTCVLLALCNIDGVPMLPNIARRAFRSGLRDRLWRSPLGSWLAKRLGAPTTSRPVDVGVFRATEVALGVAAGELFAALPKPQQQHLGSLPGIVAALEARAAGARARIDELDLLMQHAGTNAGQFDSPRTAAKAQLGESVAALEGIRLDLLRLLAGTNDLAPLTTLLDAARVLGEDVQRLTDAQREVDQRTLRPRVGSSRIPTPA